MKKLIFSLLAALTLVSCDSLFKETGCIYSGYVRVTNDFERYDNISVPASQDMKLLVFPLSGEGLTEYDNMIESFTSNTLLKKLYVGDYIFLVYNPATNTLKYGDTPQETELTVNVMDGIIQMDNAPVYSARADGKIKADDTLRIDTRSDILVKKITINLRVIGLKDNMLNKSISAVLAGVTTNKNIYTRESGTGVASLPIMLEEVGPLEYTATKYVFDINQNVKNTLKIMLDGEYKATVNIDISDDFDGFGDKAGAVIDVLIRVDDIMEHPIVEIEKWQNIDWGEITLEI